MGKDNTFWFPHDYEPTSDYKIQALIGEFGAVGYGIYWRFVEMLHSEQEHKLAMKKVLFMAIAKQMMATVEQIEAVLKFAIDICELFKTDGEYFWSDRVNNNLDDRVKISNERSKAGKKGAESRWKAKTKAEDSKAMAIANGKMANDGTGQDRTGQDIVIYPLALLMSDQSWWEQSVSMKFNRAFERAESWESWFINKFEWRKKDLGELRKSLMDWLKNPKGETSMSLSKTTDYKTG